MMRFAMVALTALSLSAGGFLATTHKEADAGPSSTLFYCRPEFRIFYCLSQVR
jgi:hypothetical protein